MKFSARLVGAILRQTYDIKERPDSPHRAGAVRGALAYCEGAPLSSEWLYVADPAAQAPPAVSPALIVLAGDADAKGGREQAGQTQTRSEQEQRGWEQAGQIRILAAHDGQRVSAADVLNDLTRAFEFYNDWEAHLSRLEMADAPCQELLTLSARVLGNPLALINVDQSSVALFPCDPEKAGAAAALFPDTEAGQIRLINALLQDSDFRENLKRTDPYWGPAYILGFRTLNINLAEDGRQNGYLLSLAEQARPLTESDMDLLTVLSPFVGLSLSRIREYRAETNTSLHRILKKILSERTLDYTEASRILASLGWEPAHDYLCLIFRLTYLDRHSLPSAAICRYMEEQFPFSSSFVYEDDIVTFFDLSLNPEEPEDVMDRLKPFIRDSYLKAGYSRVVRGHMNLRRQYVQAFLALDVGGRKAPYRWIHHFDQIAMPYLLEQMTRRLPGDMIAHPGVLRLAAYDREHKADYIRTLRTYLDRGRNTVHAAAALYIHRSTFLYRMGKITEILESDLSDPEELLYIELSLRLLPQEN